MYLRRIDEVLGPVTEDKRSLAEKLDACRSSAEINEVLHENARMSTTIETRSGEQFHFEGGVESAPLATAAPATKSDDGYLREVVRLKNGSVQVLEAYSQGGLDILRTALERSNQI